MIYTIAQSTHNLKLITGVLDVRKRNHDIKIIWHGIEIYVPGEEIIDLTQYIYHVNKASELLEKMRMNCIDI